MLHPFQSGLTLLFERRPGPGFALELRLPLGAAHDPAGQEGTAAVLEEWLHKGAGNLDARALADAFDDLGLRRGGSVTHESTRFSVSGLRSDFPRALTLLADVVRRPHLQDGELTSVLDLARQDLESLADSPADQLAVRLRELAFARPYAHPVSGTLAGIAAITPETARAFHSRYGSRGAALAVVGDFEEQVVHDLVTVHFGDWQGGGQELPAVIFQGDFVRHQPDDSQQTHINVLFRSPGPTEPGWLAFHVALGALAGGSASRLFEEVREKRGLAYSVGASVHVTGRDGFVWAYAGSTPGRAAQTLDVLLNEFARLRQGVTSEEFERARTQLLAATVFAAETARGRASALTRDWLTLGAVRALGEVRRDLEALTLADVNELLAERPFERPAVMSLGQGAVLRNGAHALA
ncbi:putative Zn-dependent peptidase [Deinococcus peraridilitoris DSM 19664]|uniref:Putative Zn-dependent peptidase n=1 Tax=Deinococcus peraridilitoris (strain DSM 19664 / LMG 22246 / CIP 109416 / KR-200) TaxID=937777 RepID=L0A3H9_DEIPD|nr:putative Zn-dependent peptidase [Deinococcus peraridilitoris DSM 19664]